MSLEASQRAHAEVYTRGFDAGREGASETPPEGLSDEQGALWRRAYQQGKYWGRQQPETAARWGGDR